MPIFIDYHQLEDFDIGNDDVVKVLENNGVGNQTIDEVVGILNSMRGDIIGK